jgi:hypothetical protein
MELGVPEAPTLAKMGTYKAHTERERERKKQSNAMDEFGSCNEQ